MAELRKNGAYIWITWLSMLLTGEHSCEWLAWFKAHHETRSWEKVSTPFDQTMWQMAHNDRVVAVRDQWEADGYRVFTENQNSFVLRGRTATLGGKPDLIAVQVVLYMYAVPNALARFRDITFTGSVAYPGYAVEIPATAVDGRFVEHMARRVPSVPECRFCAITRADCPERLGERESWRRRDGRLLARRHAKRGS